MEDAVARCLQAIESNERISIYSDFDADGIPGGAILHDALIKMGHENFVNYIPHRDTEGYGFHAEAVEKLAKDNVTLIITVDVGTVDFAAAAFARECGIDVIITDHHLPEEKLPDAVAVINPHRHDETYPFPHLCGSGVAFKLVQALFIRAREEKKEWVATIPEGWEKWLLDLVAIGTVGDMMPLLDENRALVHYGLLVLRKSPRPGIAALCKKLRIQQRHITEDDIGFSIAPRLNAASRMASPEKGFALLTTQDPAEAHELASELDSLNNKRKGHVASIVKELKERFKDDESNVLVAGSPKWNPALLGLAANSLVDTYGKTVCVWGREGTGNIKGSCRGNGDVHVVRLFEEAQDALTTYGGHEHAGGFAAEHERVHALGEVLNEAFVRVAETTEEKEVRVDAELPHTELHDTHRTLSKFAPFGIENPKPVFVFSSANIISVRQFGKEDAHIEVQLSHKDSEKTIRGIAFFKNPNSFTCTPKEGGHADVLCTLELSRFMGRVQFELRIVDII